MFDRPVFYPSLEGAEVQSSREGESACTYTVTATGSSTAAVSDPRLGWFSLPQPRSLSGFSSSWGLEYEPVRFPVDRPAVLEVTSGRSTQGAVPWLAIETDAETYVLTLHWSGNWRITSTPTGEGSRIDIDLHPDGQRLELAAGETFVLPSVSIAWGDDRTQAAANLAAHLAEQAPAGPPVLTEWNHWWPYEDAEINEEVFLANAAIAADLGLDVAVLDAGWFGRSDAGSEWFAERGDWHLVNQARFPHGLAWLADRTRSAGIDFGIWIEAEAIGLAATISAERPELPARSREGEALGYVCFGSPAGRDHVLQTVGGLIDTTGARWVKWDFNLDPGAGCARDDHGHAKGDGLLRHYLGLYDVLDQLRSSYPDTVFEACSSGGLRIDAGLAAHVDAFFLSDPDWTEHHLGCLWGAAGMLPPRQLLHWPQSEWRGEHRFQKVDYSGTLITADSFDSKIKAGMLHRFGLSLRLTEMRPDLIQRLREHLDIYRTIIRPLVETGVLIPLTEQPLREEKGHRQPAFQLTSGDAHVVAGFRLPPTGAWQPIRTVGLDPLSDYSVRLIDGADVGEAVQRAGKDLCEEGLRPLDAKAGSALWSITRAG